MSPESENLRSLILSFLAKQDYDVEFFHYSPPNFTEPTETMKKRAEDLMTALDCSDLETSYSDPDFCYDYFGGGIEIQSRLRAYSEQETLHGTVAVITPDGVVQCLPLDDPSRHKAIKVAEKRTERALATGAEQDHRAAWYQLHLTVLGLKSIGTEMGPAHEPYERICESMLGLLKHSTENEAWLVGDWLGGIAEEHQDRLAEAIGVDLPKLQALANDLSPASPASPASEYRNRPNLVGYVYTLTMPDGQVYVGKTDRTPDERWAEHRKEAAAGNGRPVYRALRYWAAQGREPDIRWRVEEEVQGWGPRDLSIAEGRWISGIGTLNVMSAARVATVYPE